ncbi:MAG: ATP-dependent helicase, partial [Saprospiraceae bacterium]
LEVSDELISLEVEVEHIPFTDPNAKRFEPTGPAFHEKKAKNQKVNRKIRRAEAMKLKYKKPKTRGQKKKGKK